MKGAIDPSDDLVIRIGSIYIGGVDLENFTEALELEGIEGFFASKSYLGRFEPIHELERIRELYTINFSFREQRACFL